MKKDILGLGIALLVASTVIGAPVATILSVTGTIGTIYGFLAKEIEEE